MSNPTKPAHVKALQQAITILGSQAALARALSTFLKRPSLKQQTVSKWLLSESFIKAEYWRAFEVVTNGLITRRDLRPDLHAHERKRKRRRAATS